MAQREQIEAWIKAGQQGDRAALAKLLATFHPRLRMRAVTRMDPALKARISPDDILQQVYLDVARRIDRFEDRGPDSFANWMRAILDQKLIDAQRAAHRQMRDIDLEAPIAGTASGSYWNLLDDVYTESGTPSRAVRRQEAISALLLCLGDLSEAHRAVIQLRYLDGLSVEEVAARLRKSKAAVVALSKRALETLRASMDRLGEFTSGG